MWGAGEDTGWERPAGAVQLVWGGVRRVWGAGARAVGLRVA